MKTIIKGAIYFDEDIILRPHYSGNFYMVDCTEYKTKEQIKDEYSDWRKRTGKDTFPITHEGVKYYECDHGPYHTDKFELLSDLSSLEYFDEDTEF